MALDLTIGTLWGRRGALVEADCLILLDHELRRDRVRRILYDRISSITVKQRWPIFSMTIGLLLAALGVVITIFSMDEGKVIGGIIFLLGLAIFGLYVIKRRITIRITREGRTETLKVLVRPAKVQRFLDKIIPLIHAAQSR